MEAMSDPLPGQLVTLWNFSLAVQCGLSDDRKNPKNFIPGPEWISTGHFSICMNDLEIGKLEEL